MHKSGGYPLHRAHSQRATPFVCRSCRTLDPYRMEPYLFSGAVLPERAQLSLSFSLEFSHVTSGITGVAKVSIVLNQVAVWVESEHDWDILDLRNVVKNIVQTHLAMVGYLKGYAYDFEVTRVL